MWNKIKPYAVSILIALLVGGVSALLTKDNMNLEGVTQPALSPPSWIFPVVWTILFILMGLSAAMVCQYGPNRPLVKSALWIYGLQLAVNFFWSIIFFNLQNFLLAFIWLLLLLVLIIAMIIKFKKIKPVAAYLQIPYLLWVTFAGYLTFAIYLLNR